MSLLRPGDLVALVSPAGPTPTADVERAAELLSSWGLRVRVAAGAGDVHSGASYLAGGDDVRARDLQQAWCDPEVAAILCLRGGYGAVRILDLLDREAMVAARPKPVVGSSDITAVHEWLREELGAVGLFSPMVGLDSLVSDDIAREGLRSALLDPQPPGEWTSPTAVTLVPGTATGTLIGGNLSLLAMTLGARTRRPIDNAGCIALLEDVTESTYRVDGYLISLLRAGWFEGITGIALGSWADCGPVDEIHALCSELLGPLGLPMIGEIGFGHCVGAHSVPLGVHARISGTVANRPRLCVERSAA